MVRLEIIVERDRGPVHFFLLRAPPKAHISGDACTRLYKRHKFFFIFLFCWFGLAFLAFYRVLDLSFAQSCNIAFNLIVLSVATYNNSQIVVVHETLPIKKYWLQRNKLTVINFRTEMEPTWKIKYSYR